MTSQEPFGPSASGLGVDALTWRRLEPLLDEALDLAPAQRDAWLEALPAQHRDLQDMLRQLLARSQRIDSAALLDTLPAMETGDDDDHSGAAPGHADAHAAGELIGPYRLLRRLGVGGMGTVWLAERADGLMAQREVALKLPFGPFRGDLATRIAREREILATLDHPHIARLYDAGVAADGQPFLALEHVDGQRIDQWCEQQQLDVPARLALFLQVAHAVAYAHSQLVVHRDLKPSNLLVDATGAVKLLDFGIARLLDDGIAPAGELTQQGARAFTPDYAAPEQVSGQPVGTRADVYALGVLLFELLTGKRPYRLKRDSRAALEEAILAADVPRPSDVAGDSTTRRALRGDLDTIVRKALKKPANERYASVDALADDIERYLSSRPVLARPDGLAYRARKFVVRNRLPVAVAAALLVTVMAGAGAAIWQARIAIAERERAEAVKNFVVAIFREASPYEGSGSKELTAVDLLKQADKKLDAALAGRDGKRIELSNMIGESLAALGDMAAAEPVIARSVAQADAALGPMHPHTLRALLIESQVHRHRGRPQQALANLDRVLPGLRDEARRANDKVSATALGTALLHRALTAIDLGAYADAERFATEAAALTEARLGERDALTVGSAVLLPLALRYTKKFEQARDGGERALRLAMAVHGETPPHPRVIEARAIYARTLGDTGELARGIAMLETALVDTRTLLGAKNLQAAILMQNLVDYQLDFGELERADANAAEALAIIGEHLAHDSMSYALTLHTRAMAHLALVQAAPALDHATRAAALVDKLVGTAHETSVAAHTTAALALAQQGRLDEAAQEVAAVVPHSDALPGTNAQRARVARARGTIARLRGDAPATLQHLQSLADSTETAPKWQRERMRAWAQIGLTQLDQGAPASAITSLERALKAFEQLEAQVTPARAEALLGLGRAHLAQGKPKQALPPLEQADQFWRAFDPASRAALDAREWLARARAAGA
jgi:eukaryotic-like serine/threonine-protein kinase